MLGAPTISLASLGSTACAQVGSADAYFFLENAASLLRLVDAVATRAAPNVIGTRRSGDAGLVTPVGKVPTRPQ